jgi:hypothetical protein
MRAALPSKPLAAIAAGGLLGVYAFLVALAPIWEIDIWWHLRVGEWIVEHKELPTTDLFSSHTPERPWTSFNWLFQVGSYLLYQGTGLFGLRLFTALLVVTGYLLWFRFFLRETRSLTSSFLLAALLLLLFDDRIRIRPHVFNFLAEALLALWLQGGARLASWRARALFFGAFLLWANLHHPGAVLGALVLAFAQLLRMALARVESRRLGEAMREALWPFGLCAVAILAHPYGPAILVAARDNIEPVHGLIGEWKPVLAYLEGHLSPHHVLAALVPFLALLWTCIVVLGGVLRRRLLFPENRDWLARAAAPLAFLALSLVAMRFVYLAMAPLAWLASRIDWSATRRKVALLVATAGVVAASFHYSVLLAQGGVGPFFQNLGVDVKRDHYPESAAALIREARLKGKVFALSVWGGYLLWTARPPGGVAADGRQNMAPWVLALHHEVELSVRRDGLRLARALNALGAELAVLPAGSFPFGHHPRDQWIRVAHDAVSETFVRIGSADLARVARFLGATTTDPASLEQAASAHSGERYLRTQAERLARLESDASHASFHELVEILWTGWRRDEAVARLVAHLRERPNCLRGATELARFLHDLGRVAQAARLLRPAEGASELPPSTRALLMHLRECPGLGPKR